MAYTSLLSYATTKKILYYYLELLNSYETKTMEEICSELSISRRSLNSFLYHHCPRSEKEINRVGKMILLCTKFGANSPYTNIQKRYLEDIKHREYVRIVKAKARECNNIIDQKNKTR